MTRFVVVTGMHRSGTSLVSRIVNLLGVSLGPPSGLMEAKPDNPAGFWENKSITQFNDDLLAALGGRWDDPPVLEDGWEEAESLTPLVDDARRLLDRLFGSAELAGWKDPRMSMLLPFWRRAADIDRTILVIRHPLAASRSLESRDGMDLERAAQLWLRYTLDAWRNDRHRLVLPYTAIMEHPEAEIRRMADLLGLRPDQETLERARAAVRGDLRHHAEAWEPTTGTFMRTASVVYRLLIAGEDDAIDVLSRLYHERLVADSRMEDLEARVASLDEVIRVRDETIDDLLGQRDRAMQVKDEAIADLTAQRDVAVERMRTLDDVLVQKDRHLGIVERENRLLGQKIEALREEKQRLHDRVEETERRLERLLQLIPARRRKAAGELLDGHRSAK